MSRKKVGTMTVSDMPEDGTKAHPQILLVRRGVRLGEKTIRVLREAGYVVVHGNREDFAALDVLGASEVTALTKAALSAIRNSADYSIRGLFVNAWIDAMFPDAHRPKP